MEFLSDISNELKSVSDDELVELKVFTELKIEHFKQRLGSGEDVLTQYEDAEQVDEWIRSEMQRRELEDTIEIPLIPPVT